MSTNHEFLTHRQKIEYLIRSAISDLKLEENMKVVIERFGNVASYEKALREDFKHMNAAEVNEEYAIAREVDAFINS